MNICIPSEPVISFPDIYSKKKNHTRVFQKTCERMFIIAVFEIVPNWEQCKCPSAIDWINKL